MSEPILREDRAELAEQLDRHRSAWTALRDSVLHGGIDGFDNDQINAVLAMIDEHMPEDV